LTENKKCSKLFTMKILFSKIVLCHTHKRFKRIFDKLENEGYALYVRGDFESPEYEMKVRRYIKNLGKTIALYDKFVQ
jgi:hypothetical protein